MTTVETVVLLSQLKPDDYIDVELNLEELDVTASEKAATYQQNIYCPISTFYLIEIAWLCDYISVIIYWVYIIL